MISTELTLDRLEGDKAVLKTPENETVVWPRDLLPGDPHDGAVYFFRIRNHEEKEKEGREQAKDILNEILSDGV